MSRFTVSAEDQPMPAEAVERCRALMMQIIPIIQDAGLDDVAAVLSMLLGQNIGHVAKNSDIPLETLVDRITFAVRVNAEAELSNVDDGESHRQH